MQNKTQINNSTGRIEVLAINQIKPYWRNPRDNEKAVDAVALSITNYGYNQFIVVDTKLVIIAGHTRFKALKKLGWTEIQVIVADLDDKKAKEYRIADNATSELADWNDEFLIKELRETELSELAAYFPTRDLDALIQESTGTIKWNEITESDVTKTLEAEGNKIGVLTEKRTAATQEVMCPHCGEEFQVV